MNIKPDNQFVNYVKIRKMSYFIIFFVLVLLIVLALFVLSPGKPRLYIDQSKNVIEGSLSEKVFLNVGGVKQGMFIKSKNVANPVLLYLHGGMPDYFLTSKYPTGLDELYTVVWWEQRGSGISFNSETSKESFNLNQMIEDVIEVTNYLRKRFQKERIYLMGHSGGTFIGINVINQASSLYHAYLGVAQMSNQLESEKLAYDYMLEYYKAVGNQGMVQKLLKAPIINGISNEYLKIRDYAMHQIGVGTTHEMNSVITGIFLPSILCKDYTLTEKINMWRGKSSSGVSSLWDEMLSTNLMKTVPSVDIPIYFFEGIFDYTVSYELAKEYFINIEAPIKGFYTFHNSAHSPLFEEPLKLQKIILVDVLNGTNSMTDIE